MELNKELSCVELLKYLAALIVVILAFVKLGGLVIWFSAGGFVFLVIYIAMLLTDYDEETNI